MSKNFSLSFDSQGNVVASGLCTATHAHYEVSVPREQFEAWETGTFIQRAMPQLSNEQREFFITHTTPAEWTALFKDYEEENSRSTSESLGMGL